MRPVDIWHAGLDAGYWPGAHDLPEAERERGARILRPRARRRWVAARWALRRVLGLYLEQAPAEVELRLGAHGKPLLADSPERVHFNLSHSGERALIAVAERPVGVDVERIGARPGGFYASWTKREAVAKCIGVGLGVPLPDDAVATAALDVGGGYAAAVAIEGGEMPPCRWLIARPDASSVGAAQLAVVPGGRP